MTLDDGGWILEWGRWTSPTKILESSLIGAGGIGRIPWDEGVMQWYIHLSVDGFGCLFWFPIFAFVIKRTSVISVVKEEGVSFCFVSLALLGSSFYVHSSG